MDDAKLLRLPAEEASTLATTLTESCDSSFKPLFAHQNRGQTAMLRTVSSKPNQPKWNGMGRVTLMGDSAHAMSPTAGAGATTAVRDAAMQAHILASEGVSMESLEKYKTAMRGYAEESIRKSMFGRKMMFGMQPFVELKPAVFGRV